jgi:hypothetical protein
MIGSPLRLPFAAGGLAAAASVGLLAAACVSLRGGRAGNDALAYGLPSVPAAVYAYGDTTLMNTQVGAVEVRSRGTVELAFEPAESGFRATARWVDFEGRLASPQGAVDADESGIEGPLVLNVDERGRVELADVPQLTDAFRQVAGAPGIMGQALFIRLPGRVVEPGAEWVDTVRVTEESEGLTSTFQAVVTSTWAGDTIVEERTLRVIRRAGTLSLGVHGVTQGVEIRQSLTGESVGVALWDPERRLLVSREESAELRGTMELPAMGVQGVPVRARTRTRLALQDG